MIIEGKLFLFFTETYVVTPHLNRLVKMGSDEGSQHMFYAELIKSIPIYHQILLLISVPSNAQAGSHSNVKILGNGHYSGRSRAA